MQINLGNNTIAGEQDLQVALQALYISATVIYYKFQIVFKIIGLIILGALSYWIGKISVSEPLAKRAKKIQKQIKQIENQKQQLPKRIQNISKTYIKFIVLSILLIGLVGGGVYMKIIKINPLYLSPIIIIPIVLYIIRTIHISTLKSKTQQFVAQQKNVRQQVLQFNSKLGSKVQSNLKSILCRDKLISKQNSPTHICTKKQCQQLRQALRVRYQTLRILAQSALQFQFCSTCKNRKPFDQLVRFQAKPMPAHGENITEQQDADLKINYLLQVMQEIEKWIQQAGPCNCSKLYMEQILKSRKQTAKTLKQANMKIQYIEKQKKAALAQQQTSTVVRTDSRNSNSSVSSTNNVINATTTSTTPIVMKASVVKKNQ